MGEMMKYYEEITLDQAIDTLCSRDEMVERMQADYDRLDKNLTTMAKTAEIRRVKIIGLEEKLKAETS